MTFQETFDDPGLGIEWPMAPAVISEKDTRWPDFQPRPALVER